MTPLDVALCYESVLPSKGGAETYLGDLSRRLAADGHRVHLYACRWDAATLPAEMVFHQLPPPGGPRWLRPWRFAESVLAATAAGNHDVTVGFDKTYGQDVLYPQGGLHAASRWHNRLKFGTRLGRLAGGRGQVLRPGRPVVRPAGAAAVPRPGPAGDPGHQPDGGRALQSVPGRAVRPACGCCTRPSTRGGSRPRTGPSGGRRSGRRGASPTSVPVGLIVAMNYRLKGLAPLIEAVALGCRGSGTSASPWSATRRTGRTAG